jgi:glutathione S-transferase
VHHDALAVHQASIMCERAAFPHVLSAEAEPMDMTMLKLYFAKGSCSLASHIALEEAGATYELERVDLGAGDQRKPDYLKMNPKGRVPALLTDQGVVTENPAILAYVAQIFPGAKLADNGDSYAFATMQSFNMFLASSVHVAFAHNIRPQRYGDGEAAAEAMRAKAPVALAEYFGLIQERFADGRPFVMGEQYTVADPYLFVFERWLKGELGRLADYPGVAAHHARVAARPAVKAALTAEGDE